MAKDYLIKFDDDGNRGETHDAAFMADEDAKKYLDDGFVYVSTADYMRLLGNTDDGQVHIRQADGEYVPKPAYVPTAAEKKAAAIATIQAKYQPDLEALLGAKAKGGMLGNDTTAIDMAYKDKLAAMSAEIKEV